MFLRGDFFGFPVYVHYSTLLHLPPLRFHCARGFCSVATLALTVRRSNQSARSRPLNLAFEIKGQRKNVLLENLAVPALKLVKEKTVQHLLHRTFYMKQKFSRKFKGTQDWDFFWLRFWNLYYFFISYVKILRFHKKKFLIRPLLGEIRFFRLVWD